MSYADLKFNGATIVFDDRDQGVRRGRALLREHRIERTKAFAKKGERYQVKPLRQRMAKTYRRTP